MTTPAEQRVLDLLDQKNGNVKAVAQLLGSSESYVSRVKKSEEWKAPDKSLVPVKSAPVVKTAEQQIEEFLPANVPMVMEIRDENLDQLLEMVRNNGLGFKEHLDLAKAVWRYETQLRQAVTPSINAIINNDNRRVQITALVDELEDRLSPDALRKVAGLEPIVEGEVIEEDG